MKVSDVLNAKPGDPPIQYDEYLHGPTPKELHERCSEILKPHERGKQKEEDSLKEK